jgi:hypothetical protein
MTPMSKWTVVAVTAGVWLTAVGSAAALTYGLNRPLHFADGTSQHRPRHAAPPNTAVVGIVEPARETQSILRLPTINIVGQVDERHGVSTAPKDAVDISQMRCSEWRELDIGSGHVKVCE